MSASGDQNLDPCIEKKGFYYVCNACEAPLNSMVQIRSHVQGKNHQKRKNSLTSSNKAILSGNNNSQTQLHSIVPIEDTIDFSVHTDLPPFIKQCGNSFKCTCCNIPLNGIDQVKSHVSGIKHKKAMKSSEISVKDETKSDYDSTSFCSGLAEYDTTEVMKSLKCIAANEPIVF